MPKQSSWVFPNFKGYTFSFLLENFEEASYDRLLDVPKWFARGYNSIEEAKEMEYNEGPKDNKQPNLIKL